MRTTQAELVDGDARLSIGPDGKAHIEIANVTVKVWLTTAGYDSQTNGGVAYGGGYHLAIELLELIHELGYLHHVDAEALGIDLQPLDLPSLREA
jgi:hypothetical protein